VLEVFSSKKGTESSARYRWKTDVKEFRLPIRVMTGKGQWGWITPTAEWQTMSLSDLVPEDFAVEKDRFYVDVRLNNAYLDPTVPERRRRSLPAPHTPGVTDDQTARPPPRGVALHPGPSYLSFSPCSCSNANSLPEKTQITGHSMVLHAMSGFRIMKDLLRRGVVCALLTVLLAFPSQGAENTLRSGDDDAVMKQYKFDRSGFGQSPLPFWYELTEFERMALDRKEPAKAGDPQALFALAIVASGDERSMETWDRFRNRVEEFVRKIRPDVEQAAGQKARGRVVFDEMYRTFFKPGNEKEGLLGYDAEQSQLTELLRSGRYNCISSSLLYLVCARYFNLTVKGVELPSHVFVQLETETGEKIDIETTSNRGYGLVHDEAFYNDQSEEWYKSRKMIRSTWQHYLDRKILEPYQVVTMNMFVQHTAEQRMSKLDGNRLLEASGYLHDMDRRCVCNRLGVYHNEYVYFDQVGDTLNMLHMFSRVGSLLQDLKRSWMGDTALSRKIADFVENQYHALLRNGRESEALALMTDAMDLLKTGDTSYVSMMNALDRLTNNHIIRQVEGNQFERSLGYFDRYAPFMRPGSDLVDRRSYVHESWGYACGEQKNWDLAIAQYGKALASTADTAAVRRIKGNIVSAYLRWSGDLWGNQAWQQVVEKCSTALMYAPSEESKRSIHERIVGAYVDWCNELVKSGAWAPALEKITRAGRYASTGELRDDLAAARSSVHESWGRACWERKEWEQTVAQYDRALAMSADSAAVRRINDNIAGAYLSWSTDLWDRQVWQQVVEKCSTAQMYAQSDERKQVARKNLVSAYVNWSRELVKSDGWSDALERLSQAEALAPSGDRHRDLTEARVYVHESWAQTYWEQKKWEEAIVQFNVALADAGDEAVVRRIRDNIAGAYLQWSGDLWAAKSWQQVVEKCSTAQTFAQSDERRQTARKNMLNAYLNWGNALSGSGAWDEALATLQVAVHQAGDGDLASKCNDAIASTYNAWGSTLFKQEHWQEAIGTFTRGLPHAGTDELRNVLQANIQGAYLNWALGLKGEKDKDQRRKVLQQCVEQCPVCTKCQGELDKLSGR
jgi:tetratricopeptide (TPR) repeat protein